MVYDLCDVYNLYVVYDVNNWFYDVNNVFDVNVYNLYVVYDVNNVCDVHDIILMRPSGQLTNHNVTLWVNEKTTSLFSLGIIGELGKSSPFMAELFRLVKCGNLPRILV